MLSLLSVEVLKETVQKFDPAENSDSFVKEKLIDLLNERDLESVLGLINLDELKKIANLKKLPRRNQLVPKIIQTQKQLKLIK